MQENNQNANQKLTDALGEVNASIFEIGDTIPEGIYLSMMNNTKKIFDQVEILRKKTTTNINVIRYAYGSTAEQVNHILNAENKVYHLRRMERVIDPNNQETLLKIYEGNAQLPLCMKILRVNDLLRIFDTGNRYKFIRIKKINEKSIKYDIIYKHNDGHVKIDRGNALVTKSGEYFEDLTTKNIYFYNHTMSLVNYLFNEVTNNILEHEFITATNLTIRIA
jgi:hypothetical protein